MNRFESKVAIVTGAGCVGEGWGKGEYAKGGRRQARGRNLDYFDAVVFYTNGETDMTPQQKAVNLAAAAKWARAAADKPRDGWARDDELDGELAAQELRDGVPGEQQEAPEDEVVVPPPRHGGLLVRIEAPVTAAAQVSDSTGS